MDELTWQAYEFEQPERHPNWFAVLWIFALALVAVAVILKSYLLGVFVILAAGVIHLFALREPSRYTFTLTPENLTVGNKTHNLADFESFWIFEYEDGNVLSLAAKRVLSINLHVPLATDISPEAVRNILLPVVTEKEQEESLIDVLSHWLKF